MITIITNLLNILIKILVNYTKISERLKNFVTKISKRSAGSFSYQEVIEYTKNYINPRCQKTDPSFDTESNKREIFIEQEDLFQAIETFFNNHRKYKYVLLLGDTGTGKTAFLINLYIKYQRKIFSPIKVVLTRVNDKNLKSFIKKVKNKKKTIILLDAFDEDILAIENHRERMTELCSLTQDFNNIVISCRTQFFPKEVEMPDLTSIQIFGPASIGQEKVYRFQKRYILPFGYVQKNAYLEIKFKDNKLKLEKAKKFIQKIPHLSARPMILAYIDDLITLTKNFKYSFQIYEEIVDQWLQRELGILGITDKKPLRDFCERLAIELFSQRAERESELLPYDAVDPLAKKFKIDLAAWKITGRSLLNKDSQDNFKFAHRSIMEYLFIRQIFYNIAKTEIPKIKWTNQMGQFFIELLLSMKSTNSIQINLKKIDIPIIKNTAGIESIKLRNISSSEIPESYVNDLLNNSVLTSRNYKDFRYIIYNSKNQNLILDLITDLTWQYNTSDLMGNSREAKNYINQLNNSNYGGYKDWRFPTLDEIISIRKSNFNNSDSYVITSDMSDIDTTSRLTNGDISVSVPWTFNLKREDLDVYRFHNGCHVRGVRG